MDRALSSSIATGEVHWDTIRRLQRIQVFGAEGGAGRELALELLRRGHPATGLSLYGRRPGQLEWSGAVVKIAPIHGNTPAADLALLCTNPELASKLTPILQARGTRIVDQSGAHRGDPAVPMVLAGLNPQEVGAFAEVVSVPSGTAALLAPLLASLDRVVGLVAVDGHVRLAGSGAAAPTDLTRFEHELRFDLARVLGRTDLPIDVLVDPGGHERCDQFALKLHLGAALDVGAVSGLLEAAPGIQVAPQASETLEPTPETCAGGSEIHVGRIRAGSRGAVSLCCSAVGDQFRAGAALAALRVAALMPAGV